MAKARSAFYQQHARRYQSREVRAKTYNVGELVLRLPEKKQSKLEPEWEGPIIIDHPVERTVCEMHRIIDLSRTHGTQPGSEDSTPSARLYVRLLTSMIFLHICFFSLFSSKP